MVVPLKVVSASCPTHSWTRKRRMTCIFVKSPSESCCVISYTADDVFIRLPESFSNFLKIPWRSWGTNGVPNLILPLVTLLSCCCTCLYTNLLCHGIISGCVSCGGYPTCRFATYIPYLKGTLETNSTAKETSRVKHFFSAGSCACSYCAWSVHHITWRATAGAVEDETLTRCNRMVG